MSHLNTFPLSYKLHGRRVIILGGGAEALNKARLLARTSADTHLIARHFDADFAALPVTLHRRPFTPGDLNDTALLFVAEAGPDAELAKAEARRRHIPLNVVDMPAECDFYTPSIVDRAPLTIAIATEGNAPVLARLMRARIEALLAPGLGDVAALAGRLRRAAETLIADGPRRRRFYEALVTSPAIAEAQARGAGMAAAEALLARHAGGRDEGMVWLIGAGPGAEDLLTLRAQRLLQEADIIAHDPFVPMALVDMGRRDAERLDAGSPRAPLLIAQAARQGKRIAWLVAGDATQLDRPRLAALRRAGVDYQIVPGVAAPLPVPGVRVA